jgi:hypothetical protein
MTSGLGKFSPGLLSHRSKDLMWMPSASQLLRRDQRHRRQVW